MVCGSGCGRPASALVRTACALSIQPCLMHAAVRDILCVEPEFVADHLSAHVSADEFTAACAQVVEEHAAQLIQGDELYARLLRRVVIFATTCRALDDMLHGGIFTGEITEIVGSSASGKSQLCMHVAAAAVALSPHSVIYIDTSASFCAQRVASILDNPAFGRLTAAKVSLLDRIAVINAFSLQELQSALWEVRQTLQAQQVCPPFHVPTHTR